MLYTFKYNKTLSKSSIIDGVFPWYPGDTLIITRFGDSGTDYHNTVPFQKRIFSKSLHSVDELISEYK